MNKVKVVAIAFAFTFVLVAFAAQPVAAASRYDSLNSYMSDNYDVVRGGYILPTDRVTRVNPTYGAISIMNEIGSLTQRPPPVSITLVLDFSSTHQWLTNSPEDEPRYGGFMDYLLGPVNARTNYHGLATWEILKSNILSDIPGVDDYDINATANAGWVNRTASDGGYGSNPDADPDLISTYYALASFRILDNVYPTENVWFTYVNETATIEWIESCKDGDTYMLSPVSDRSSVTATAAAVLAYNAIDPLSLVPGASSIQTWLLNRQILDYQEPEFVGGFEEGNATDDPNLVSTYFALSALDNLNAVPSINVTAAESYILNCQSEDGSWSFIPGLSTGSLVYSAYACQMLNMITPGSALSKLSS
ncbi:MAG: prenyltransferase/squalene oxidase repeat-containing protein, partial [Candidatus Thorarchaeota archaeon]